MFTWCKSICTFLSFLRTSCYCLCVIHFLIMYKKGSGHSSVMRYDINFIVTLKRKDDISAIVFFSYSWYLFFWQNCLMMITSGFFWQSESLLCGCYWTLDVSQIAYNEITLISLSVRPSVTKFSQDWIIRFYWYCTWS